MSEIDGLKKPKRILKDVHFNFEGAHLAYTTKGAASLKDEPYLLKSLDTKTEEESLEEAEVSDIDNTGVTQTVSKSDELNENDGDRMSDQNDKIVALEKKLAVMTAKETIAKYGFDAEITKGLAEALTEVEDQDGVLLALDALVAQKDEAIAKAKEAGKEKEGEENPLAKALQEEEGHDDVEEPVAKSLVEQAAAQMDQDKENK